MAIVTFVPSITRIFSFSLKDNLTAHKLYLNYPITVSPFEHISFRYTLNIYFHSTHLQNCFSCYEDFYERTKKEKEKEKEKRNG